jgi:cation:H+ antiporter
VLTIAFTLFVVAALASRRPERVDAWLILGAFAVEFLYPTPFVRIAVAFVLMVFAIDLLAARRHAIRPLLRTALGRHQGAD